MLITNLSILLCAIALFKLVEAPEITRTTSLVLVASAILSVNTLSMGGLDTGVTAYNGLYTVTPTTMYFNQLILFTGSIAIIPWRITKKIHEFYASTPTIKTYSLFILFSVMGGISLIAGSDIITVYISIELQSFAAYIISTIYSESESSTKSGLLYFLLGGLSSCFILLGAAVIYSVTGQTDIISTFTLITVEGFITTVSLGYVVFIVGFLFKITAAPFHNWGPDVYDGVPTIVTTWISIIPKLSILALLLELQIGLGNLTLVMENLFTNYNPTTLLLMISSILSLIVGTVVGLTQTKIKKLLAYSTVSHVGFMLLALSNNSESSIEAYLFYIITYTITSITAFITLLSIGYILDNAKIINKTKNPNQTQNKTQNKNEKNVEKKVERKEEEKPEVITADIEYLNELKGIYTNNPVISLTISISLFSIAGVPPILGFFGKQEVLYTSIKAGNYVISLLAIYVSVISAYYYIGVIKNIYFDTSNIQKYLNEKVIKVKSVSFEHSFNISVITLILILFILSPNQLMFNIKVLSLVNYIY